MHEIVISQKRLEAEIDVGISKVMSAMIYPQSAEMGVMGDTREVFNDTGFCPPYCDERSIYNT